MTQDEFRNTVRRKNLFDTNWSYFLCIGVICLGLFFIFKNLTDLDWHNSNTVPEGLFYFGFSVLMAIGLYGFWRIPAGLKIQAVHCNLPDPKRKEILTNVIQQLNLRKIEENENYGRYKYTGRFRNPFEVFLLTDDHGFHINVQQVDYNGGLVDFGTSRRVSEKIIETLKSCL